MTADTGSSHTHLKSEHIMYLRSLRLLNNGPSAPLPDNTKIQSSHQGNL